MEHFDAQGETLGAPIDLADGYIHFSTKDQAAETAAKHFAGEGDLVLVALEAAALGASLKWEPRAAGSFSRISTVRSNAQIASGSRICRSAPMATNSRGYDVKLIERAGLKALHCLDPELAHSLSLKAMSAGLVPLGGIVSSSRLATNVAGLAMRNPVGLAAGMDKNATAVGALMRAGFGFLEVGGAATPPRPQAGNAKPRLFRLTQDRAVINRFGFNNDGMEAITERLKNRPSGISADIPVGLNLGANKDSADRAADFARVLAHAGPHINFATVNVSSPNTEKLRDLQGKEALTALLKGVTDVRDKLSRRIPIFLKIAPDLSLAEIEEIAEVALMSKIDGIIATNTTLARDGLTSAHRAEAGGLSGAPCSRPPPAFWRSSRP